MQYDIVKQNIRHEIDRIRKNLEDMLIQTNMLVTEDIIQLSTELDQLIVEYYA